MMRLRTVFVAFVVVCSGCGTAEPDVQEALARPVASRDVTLLVHGLTIHPKMQSRVWGDCYLDDTGRQHGTSLVGHLIEHGDQHFGGYIQAEGGKIQFPEDIDASAVVGDPRKGDFFSLEFSTIGNTDGIAHKTLELANCIAELRRYTGAKRVNLVCHSAGGIIGRCYLQEFLPDLEYRGDVAKFITVGTPHLGSQLADLFGSFVGHGGVPSLKTDSRLMERLNEELELPDDVMFCSFIMRGFNADILGAPSETQLRLIAERDYDLLPIDYRMGGDQVVHVCSQNLQLTRCAQQYEQETGRPVLYYLIRVKDPTPKDLSPLEEKVHFSETRNEDLHKWIAKLVADRDGGVWDGRLENAEREHCHEFQLRTFVLGAAEDELLSRHKFSKLTDIDLSVSEPESRAEGGLTLATVSFAGNILRTCFEIGFMHWRVAWT